MINHRVPDGTIRGLRNSLAAAQKNLLSWRSRFHARLIEIAAHHPTRHRVDLEALADMLVVLIDGAIILSKTVREKEALPRQIALYETFVAGIFCDAA